MAENSKIEWTTHTFNPWMGCTKVSPACKNCYAEGMMDNRLGQVQWGPNGTRVLTSDANWKKPIKWNRDAEGLDVRPRVFCASLADVFEDWKGDIVDSKGRPVHEYLPTHNAGQFEYLRHEEQKKEPATMSDVRKRLFAMIDSTPNLDWLLLTKRPENIHRFFPMKPMGKCVGRHLQYRKNVWLGTSVENQDQAEKRIPELLKCRDLAANLFLSCEPLLETLHLDDASEKRPGRYFIDKIDWVIAGGESGPNARPSHPDWFRGLRDQCEAAGVPFHFKQWGEWLPVNQVCISPTAGVVPAPVSKDLHNFEDGKTTRLVGKKASGRFLDGKIHDASPA